LFETDKVDFSFSQEALEFITDKALEYKLGARGLRSICEAIITDAMFELPSEDVQSFEVTLDYAKEKLNKSKLSKLVKVA
jgi:ATP-dependent Clp protease ATP-binding subunit ClpX